MTDVKQAYQGMTGNSLATDVEQPLMARTVDYSNATHEAGLSVSPARNNEETQHNKSWSAPGHQAPSVRIRTEFGRKQKRDPVDQLECEWFDDAPNDLHQSSVVSTCQSARSSIPTERAPNDELENTGDTIVEQAPLRQLVTSWFEQLSQCCTPNQYPLTPVMQPPAVPKARNPATELFKSIGTTLKSWTDVRLDLSLENGLRCVTPDTTDSGHLTRVSIIKGAAEISRRFRARDFRIDPNRLKLSNNPHAYEAAHRAAAHKLIHSFVASVNREVYELSSSHRSHGRRGFHDHYTPRDLEYTRTRDQLNEDDVIVGIDVDYYIDMASWLGRGQPMLLYSMTPSSLTGHLHNTSWDIQNGIMSVTVAGGANYQHQLWDYNHDMLAVTTPLGFRVHCRVDRKPVDALRSIILVTPVNVERTLSWAPGKRIEGHTLERLNTNATPGYDAMTILSKSGKLISVRNSNTATSVTLPHEEVAAMLLRFKESKMPCIADIQSTLDKLNVTKRSPVLAYNAAGILIGFFRGTASLNSVPTVMDFTYNVDTPDLQLTNEAVSRASPDCLPSITVAPPAIPCRNTSNDAAAVLTRLEDVKPPANLRLPPDLDQYMDEFKQLTLAEASVEMGSLTPTSFDDVIQCQSRPAQRQKNAITSAEPLPAGSETKECKVSAFIKAEAYASPKDPRNISATDPVHTLQLSAYTYIVKSAILKRTNWYCPGKTLPELAAALSRYCGLLEFSGHTLAETDYSRYDGTISKALRSAVEEKFYDGLFATANDNKICIDRIRAEYTAKARTGAGPYQTHGSRLSGSPLTTDGNTLIGAFVDYYMLRTTMQMEPGLAYGFIGLHFGDDGLSINVPGATKIASSFGLKLKLIERKPGDAVGFLGRIFPNPWATTDSLQDPERVWPKINLRLNGGNMDTQRARWLAYSQSDKHTPLLSAYCLKALALTGGIPTNFDPDKSEIYLFRATQSVWPSQPSQLIADHERMATGADVEHCLRLVREATTIDQLISSLYGKLLIGNQLEALPPTVSCPSRPLHMHEVRVMAPIGTQPKQNAPKETTNETKHTTQAPTTACDPQKPQTKAKKRSKQ